MMELIKKNIHMERIRASAVDQITLDDDRNIPDAMPDARAVILNQADVRLEEVKATADHVSVKGSLVFSILYQTDEETSTLHCMNGKLPFEEQVYMEGVSGTDAVSARWETEDFSVSLINSRKLNLQALISLYLTTEELYDEETAVELRTEEEAQVCKKRMEIAQIAVSKKDIFRMKEEVQLPQSEPNIYQVLWQSVVPSGFRFEPMEGRIGIKGELRLFLLYEGEGEDAPVRSFSTGIPVNGTLECHECREQMLSDIACAVSHQEVEVRPDFDGEERVIGIDLALDLDIRLYEQEPVELLSDVYGVTQEIEAVTRPAQYRRFVPVEAGECRIAARIRAQSGAGKAVQILYSEGVVHVEQAAAAEDGLEIEGSLCVRVLYLSGDETQPYGAAEEAIPFRHRLEAPGLGGRDTFRVRASLKQLSAALTDGEELEIKAALCFRAVAFSQVEEAVISDIRVSELDAAKMGRLPGIVAYVAREGDTLWQIGKKYYVPIERIMEMNDLTSETLRAGDQLLIVK